MGGLVGLACHHAGPVAGDGGQIDLRNTACVCPAISSHECLPSLPEEDQVARPALGEERQDALRCIAEREHIGPGGGKTMADVDACIAGVGMRDVWKQVSARVLSIRGSIPQIVVPVLV